MQSPYRHHAAIVVLSHRPELVGEAMASATHQTMPCQVVVQHSKQNWPEKVNTMVKATDAEWVCVLCDDDLLDPAYIETCLQYAEQADVIYTNRLVFTDDGWAMPHRTHGPEVHGANATSAYRTYQPWQAFSFGSPLLMTILVRRSLWDQHGGYDGFMPHADTEFWYRLIRGTRDIPPARTVYVDQPLMHYRNHDQQLSRSYASFLPFLKAFHWKHFDDFGVVIHGGTGQQVPMLDPLQLEPVPPHERLAVWAALHNPLTSSGAMATETAPLSYTQKRLMQMVVAEAAKQTQEVVDSIMAEAGKNPADGWKISQALEFVREVPDQLPETAQGAPALAIVKDVTPAEQAEPSATPRGDIPAA